MTNNLTYPAEFEGLPKPETYVDAVNAVVLYTWKGRRSTVCWLVESNFSAGAIIDDHDGHKCVSAGITDFVEFAELVRQACEDEGA